MVFFENTDKHVVGYTLLNTQTADKQWKKVACIFNSNTDKDAEVTIEGEDLPGEWVVIANQTEAGVEMLGEVSGNTVTVPKTSAVILVDKESFERVGLTSAETLREKLKNAFVQEAKPPAQAEKKDEKQDSGFVLPVLFGAAVILIAGAAAGIILYRKKSK